MVLFLSKYINKIDQKGRISIPASFRNILGNYNGVVLYPSIKHNCIEGCSISRLEELNKLLQNLDPYSDERDAFETTILGESIQISFDGEGRIIVPKYLSDYASLNHEACFIGKGAVFEIWEPNKFQKYLTKAKEIAFNNKNLLKNV